VLANLAMPGSSNFAAEFMILLGVFKAKLAISVIAFLGVIGAAVYSLRVYIRTMHNPLGPRVQSREISWHDGLAIAPLVLVILVLAFYPQFGLRRSEQSLRATMAPAEIQEGLSPAAAAQVVAAGTPRRVSLASGGGP
jgi:NADH-quinone oxidoreductase subunit M